MADETPTPLPEIAPPKPRRITKLSDLQAMVDQKFTVQIDWLDQGTVEIEGRRLTPAESAALTDLRYSVLPPTIKGKTAEEDKFDFNDPKFVAAKRELNRKERAVGIYWAYYIFATELPGTPTFDEIQSFVQSKTNEVILTALWEAMQDGGVRKVALVNFSSANSPRS